jgi:quercetin dioxygenase-like cupin family protein
MVPPERRMRAAGAKLEHDREVSHMLINDPARELTVQPGAVVSKVVHRGDGLNVTVFAFDAGEQLTEHQASRTAVVQVVSGRLRFTVENEQLDLGPGSWLHMSPGAPHSLVAVEPTVMLLTLIGT